MARGVGAFQRLFSFWAGGGNLGESLAQAAPPEPCRAPRTGQQVTSLSRLVRNAEARARPHLLRPAEPVCTEQLPGVQLASTTGTAGSWCPSTWGLWSQHLITPAPQISASPGQRSSICRPSPEQVTVLPRLHGRSPLGRSGWCVDLEGDLGTWAWRSLGSPPSRSHDNGGLSSSGACGASEGSIRGEIPSPWRSVP